MPKQAPAALSPVAGDDDQCDLESHMAEQLAEQVAAEKAADRDRLMRYACRTLVERAVLDRKSLEILNRGACAIAYSDGKATPLSFTPTR